MKNMITTKIDQDKHLFEEYIIVSFVACILISMAELKFLAKVSKAYCFNLLDLSSASDKFHPQTLKTRRGKAAKRREWMPSFIFFPMLLLKWLLIPFRRGQLQHNKYPQGHFHYDQNKPHSLHRQNAFDMYA
jgi:hypothetical protein